MKFDHLVRHNGVDYPAGAEVPVEVAPKVELTDNVPEGALDTNPDGSVNAYDEEGNVVGTVAMEEVEKLQEEVGEVIQEQQTKKRGKK